MAAVLGGVDLFAELSTDEVSRIAAIGRTEYFPCGATLLAEGENGPRLLVVLEGRVQVSRADRSGVQRSIGTLGPGEVLGEIALLLDLPRTATVTALDDLKCIAIDRAAFQDMVRDGDPAALKLGMALARTLASRLITLNDRVLELLASEDGTADRFADERQSLFRLWG